MTRLSPGEVSAGKAECIRNVGGKTRSIGVMHAIGRLVDGISRYVALGFSAAAFAAEGDPATGTWIVTAPCPIFASEHGAAVVDNKIYVAGGFAGPNQAWTGTTDAFLVYDPITNAWANLPPLPKKLHHFGMAALENRIYVTGGYTDEDFETDNKSVYVFDPRAANAGWAPVADLPAERAAHVSVAAGGLLYVIGGVGNDPVSIRAFHPATNRWDGDRAPMPTGREHLTAEVVNDRIYVISGRAGAGNLPAVEEYNPATNTWTRKADIQTPRSGITSGVINGRIHVTGGEDHVSNATYSSHEVYDPATDRWSTLPGMPTARHGLASGVANGRWHVIGGGRLVGGETFSSLTNVVEAFLPGPDPLSPPVDPGRIANVSVLATLTAGETFSLGFVVGGEGAAGPKPLLIRAVGPSLAPFIGNGALEDPRLELFTGASRTGENDNWGGAASLVNDMAAVGAFALAGAGSRDAALPANVPRGDNSVRISAAGTGGGTVLAEIYERPPAPGAIGVGRLVNVSVLKTLGSGLTVGFVIAGSGPRTLLIRAVGPTLGAAPFNMGGVVADPELTLFSGTVRMGGNNDWGGTDALVTAFAQVGAFALPAGSRDAALVTTLSPGNHSVQVAGVAGSGVALVEIYELR